MGKTTKWACTGSNRVAPLAAAAALFASVAGWVWAGSPAGGAGSIGPENASTGRPAQIIPGAVNNNPTPHIGPRADMLAGPISAHVARVVDGDTLLVSAHIWIDQKVQVAVRIRGIDAPELKAGCAGERTLALRAADFVRKAVSGKTVRLSAVSGDKYFGRVLADVTTADERALGPELVAAGLARPYDGGRRTDWCGSAAIECLNQYRQGSAPAMPSCSAGS